MTELEALTFLHDFAVDEHVSLVKLSEQGGHEDLIDTAAKLETATAIVGGLIEAVTAAEVLAANSPGETLEARAYEFVRAALVGPCAGGTAKIAAATLAPLLANWITAEITAATTKEG